MNDYVTIYEPDDINRFRFKNKRMYQRDLAAFLRLRRVGDVSDWERGVKDIDLRLCLALDRLQDLFDRGVLDPANPPDWGNDG